MEALVLALSSYIIQGQWGLHINAHHMREMLPCLSPLSPFLALHSQHSSCLFCDAIWTFSRWNDTETDRETRARSLESQASYFIKLCMPLYL